MYENFGLHNLPFPRVHPIFLGLDLVILNLSKGGSSGGNPFDNSSSVGQDLFLLLLFFVFVDLLFFNFFFCDLRFFFFCVGDGVTMKTSSYSRNQMTMNFS